MKKLYTFITAALISSVTFGQVTVPQIISTTNVQDIYIRSNNRGLMYSDNTSHHIQSDNQGNITSNVNAPLANNIGLEEFLYGDTLSSELNWSGVNYYGNATSVLDGTNTFITNTPVNALTYDNDTVFVLYKNVASEYSVIAINGSNYNAIDSLLFQREEAGAQTAAP